MPLPEADLDTTQLAHGEMSKEDAKLIVRFFEKPRQNAARSREEGRPIFDMADYIEISVPGDRDNNVIRPANDMDKARFPIHWNRYKALQSQEEVGTPLSAWPLIRPDQLEELAYFKIKTVESLAGMADGNIPPVMGMLELRQRARDFLESAKDAGLLGKMRQQMEEQAAHIQQQKMIIDELTKKLDEIAAPAASTKAGK